MLSIKRGVLPEVDEKCGRSIATFPSDEKGNSLSTERDKLTCTKNKRHGSRLEYQITYEPCLSMLTAGVLLIT